MKWITVDLIDENTVFAKGFKVPMLPSHGDMIHYVDKDGTRTIFLVDRVIYELEFGSDNYTIDIAVNKVYQK